jgi:hypothetical protein
MFTIQQCRERMNRQINERLRTLIAAYKVLGGSFTGDLMVGPAHLRDIRRLASEEASAEEEGKPSDRKRRVSDAVEAALSDIFCSEPRSRSASRNVQRASWSPGARSILTSWSSRFVPSFAKRWISLPYRPSSQFQCRALPDRRTPTAAARMIVTARKAHG